MMFVQIHRLTRAFTACIHKVWMGHNVISTKILCWSFAEVYNDFSLYQEPFESVTLSTRLCKMLSPWKEALTFALKTITKNMQQKGKEIISENITT